MNSCKKTRTYVGASWRKNLLECSTHAAPAHEPLVPPIKKKGRDKSSKICANAASLFSFSISLLRSFCGVQLFLDDEDKCSGPMQNYSSLLLQSDNCEMMSFLLVALSHINRHVCYSFEARYPYRPTAYPHMGVHIFFQITITTSEILPPNTRCFYSLGAPNWAKNSVPPYWGTQVFPAVCNI